MRMTTGPAFTAIGIRTGSTNMAPDATIDAVVRYVLESSNREIEDEMIAALVQERTRRPCAARCSDRSSRCANACRSIGGNREMPSCRVLYRDS